MTRVVVDASLLVAAFIEAEVHHTAAIAWHNKAVSEGLQIAVTSHTIAELYAGLTKRDRIPPELARRLIEDFLSHCDQVIGLSVEDYREAVSHAATEGLKSGIIYDAIVVQAARKSIADFIATLNRKHFELLWLSGQMIVPFVA